MQTVHMDGSKGLLDAGPPTRCDPEGQAQAERSWGPVIRRQVSDAVKGLSLGADRVGC